MVKVISIFLWAALLSAVNIAQSQTVTQKSCVRDNSVTIQAGSTVNLGSILSVSEPGTNGYGCAPPLKCGFSYFFYFELFISFFSSCEYISIIFRFSFLLLNTSLLLLIFLLSLSYLNTLTHLWMAEYVV